MRTTVTIADETMQELLKLARTDNQTHAVNAAVEEFVRQRHYQALRALRGKVDILSNEEIEAAELASLKHLGE